MQLKVLKLKTILRQTVTFIVMLIVTLNLFMNVMSGTASADSISKIGIPSDTLTIKVGYFGGPYYTKKVYAVSDLEAMPQVQQAYTFIDKMPSVCIDSARGVKLTDLLEDSGIDVNSVEAFYFYSTDIKKGWYECLPKSFLLDTSRYYYPNLPEYWDSNNQSSIPGAVYGAIRVDPVIAILDNWQRFASSPDFTQMNGDNRFRLVFGQNDTNSRFACRSAKWVHAIEVMLGGMPPAGVTLNQNVVNLKVGSAFRLTATVFPDETADKSVLWSSSDTSVAKVDENGMVTIVGPGAAVITVSTIVGNMTDTCTVNDPNHNTNGQGIGSSGAGSQNDGVQEQRRLMEKETESAGSSRINISLGQSGSQPWRVFEMSADAVPLQREKEQNSLDIYAAVVFLTLFLFGSGSKYVGYMRED
jgi:hypothetical protein